MLLSFRCCPIIAVPAGFSRWRMMFIALSPIQPSVELCWLVLLLTVRHAACFLYKIGVVILGDERYTSGFISKWMDQRSYKLMLIVKKIMVTFHPSISGTDHVCQVYFTILWCVMCYPFEIFRNIKFCRIWFFFYLMTSSNSLLYAFDCVKFDII